VSNEEVLCLVSGARTTFSDASHQAMPSKLDRTCLKTKTGLSSKDCTRGEDGRETAKKKTKKEDAGSTYGATKQEDQLRRAEERNTEPGRMAPSSLEPALGQSTQRSS